MALPPGARLGPYEIAALLGSGGMGEVYRARDTRLARTVALKVIHPEVARDPGRQARFQREARVISSLNHPRICTLHDVGTHDGVDYLVMEYVEGETLADRLAAGPLGVEKAVELGAQIAEALRAAHRQGIVHRDLKPGNVMLTKSGVKLLDFGLAGLRHDEPVAPEATTFTRGDAPLTEEGVVLGTVPYMAPEQLEGKAADARTDVFALGAVLFEMATGRRAFQGGSRASLIASILKDDPPSVSTAQPLSPPAFDRVVRTCLAKDPDERWQDAGDLARELRWIGEGRADATHPGPSNGRGVTRAAVAAGSVVLLMGFVAGGLVTRGLLPARRAATPPRFLQATFRTGNVSSARFAPDGQGIVYSASWEGAPYELFLMRQGGNEGRALGLADARILSVSRQGEMALLRGAAVGGFGPGMLARAPLSGGAPRDLAEGVLDADWTPDGAELAVIRRVAGRRQVEFPLGHKVHEAALAFIRVSPDGRHAAFFGLSSGGHDLVIVDRAGEKTTLSTGWLVGGVGGLAWSPKGDEVVIAATRGHGPPSLYAVSLGGRERALATAPKHLMVTDVFADGRVLVRTGMGRGGMMCRPPGQSADRELGWLDFPEVADLSADGQTVVFSELRAGGGAAGSVYVRRTDGSPAVRLGEGRALALSDDGRWVLATKLGGAPRWLLLPTGPGSPRELDPPAADQIAQAGWLPDGRRIVFSTRRGPTVQTFVQDVETGAVRAVTPEGVDLVAHSITPDGRFVLGFATGAAVGARPGTTQLYAVDGGEPQPAPWLARATFMGWSADGSAAFVSPGSATGPRLEIQRVDLRSGRAARWSTIGPADTVGINGLGAVAMAKGATAYCYSYSRTLRELYVVDGLDLDPRP
jgi:eukaryotic-like serine/threonine-protein kinase